MTCNIIGQNYFDPSTIAAHYPRAMAFFFNFNYLLRSFSHAALDYMHLILDSQIHNGDWSFIPTNIFFSAIF